MARYSLIIRDTTYVILIKEAVRHGKSLGKYLNEILDAEAQRVGEAGQLPLNPVCIVCGQPAVLAGFGEGQQKLYVCARHESLIKKLKGRKKIGETTGKT